jgi:hypothetical protein
MGRKSQGIEWAEPQRTVGVGGRGGGVATKGLDLKFLAPHAAVYNTFNVQRHLTSARTHRAFRAAAMNTWREAVTAA